MGTILKYILVTVVVLYVLRMLAQIASGGAGKSEQSSRKRRASFDGGPRRKRGNINIDYRPGKSNKKDAGDYRGGEYVDYEEVD